MNHSTGKVSFEMVYTRTSTHTLDLVPGQNDNVVVSSMANELNDVHEEVRKRLQASNNKYKEITYSRRQKLLQVDDKVMIFLKSGF